MQKLWTLALSSRFTSSLIPFWTAISDLTFYKTTLFHLLDSWCPPLLLSGSSLPSTLHSSLFARNVSFARFLGSNSLFITDLLDVSRLWYTPLILPFLQNIAWAAISVCCQVSEQGLHTFSPFGYRSVCQWRVSSGFSTPWKGLIASND